MAGKSRTDRSKTGPTPARDVSELVGSAKVAATLAALSDAVDEATAGTGPVDIDATPADASEMEHIFTLNGKAYALAKNPPRSLIVGYLRKVQSAGRDAAALSVATYDLLTTMVGTEAMAALEGSPKVTDAHMDQVFSATTRVAFSAIARLTEEFAGAVTPGN
jgi:hypothetical protein